MGEANAEDIIAKEAARSAARKGATVEGGAGYPAGPTGPTVARKTPAAGVAVSAASGTYAGTAACMGAGAAASLA